MNEKLANLKRAIEELEGVEVPYNLIKHCLVPLSEWLSQEEKRVGGGGAK